jgi:hypothetical protein
MRDTSSGGIRTTQPGLRSRDWPLSASAETRCPVNDPGRLCVTARLSGLRLALAEVVALAGKAPELSDEQLRARLVRLADQAARVLGGGSGR